MKNWYILSKTESNCYGIISADLAIETVQEVGSTKMNMVHFRLNTLEGPPRSIASFNLAFVTYEAL